MILSVLILVRDSLVVIITSTTSIRVESTWSPSMSTMLEDQILFVGEIFRLGFAMIILGQSAVSVDAWDASETDIWALKSMEAIFSIPCKVCEG